MKNTEIIYGVHPVLECLRAGSRPCHELFLSEGRRAAEAEPLLAEAARHRIPVRRLPRGEVARIAGGEGHQGVAARVDRYRYATIEAIVERAAADDRKGFLLLLDGVEDPHNLGSIARTAEGMGVHGLILPRDKAAAVTPVAVKSSAGATEHLPIAQVTNLAVTLGFLKEQGYWIAGAAGEGAESIYDHDFRGRHYAVVLGAEGRGLRRLVREHCDFLLALPMHGRVASYNVSVAGALFMGEIARQRWG